MSKIVFESNGTEYTLEFDRKSVEVAERRLDVSLSACLDGKLSQFPALFQAAFLKHHPKMQPGVVQGFFESLDNKEALFQQLVSMYAECSSTLIEEPEEGKALSWKVE